MATKRHMAQSIRGALRNWTPHLWRGVVSDDAGRVLTPDEVREWLFDELGKGNELIPLCDSKNCPEFDQRGGGCPGHPVED